MKKKMMFMAVVAILALGIFGVVSASAAPIVTAEDVAPITTSFTENLGVMLPVGIGIMATMIGVSLIPRIVYKFF
jgi:hypothetical protein